MVYVAPVDAAPASRVQLPASRAADRLNRDGDGARCANARGLPRGY